MKAVSNSNTRARIVSLAPSVTSILVALGARKNLAGVTRWCRSVVKVNGIPRLGDCWALDVSAVERLRPTLVIGSVPYNADVVAKLLALPVPFLAANPRSLADIAEEIRLLGRIVGRTARAEKVVERMRSGLADVAERAARAGTKIRVYCEAWPKPRISSPPWVAELVKIAGGRMVVPAGQRIDDARVAAARPEVIVLAWTATGNRANVKSALTNAVWKDVPAVRRRSVFVVRDELLNTPGPPLVEGAWALLRLLHPELGSDRH